MSIEPVDRALTTLPPIREGLTDSERLERLERSIITMAQIVDERFDEWESILSRARKVLDEIEANGPAAFLGSLLNRRRKR